MAWDYFISEMDLKRIRSFQILYVLEYFSSVFSIALLALAAMRAQPHANRTPGRIIPRF